MEIRFCFERQRYRVSNDEPGRQLLKVASAYHLVDLCLEEASYVVAMLLDQLVRDQISSGLSIIVFHKLASLVKGSATLEESSDASENSANRYCGRRLNDMEGASKNRSSLSR